MKTRDRMWFDLKQREMTRIQDRGSRRNKAVRAQSASIACAAQTVLTDRQNATLRAGQVDPEQALTEQDTNCAPPALYKLLIAFRPARSLRVYMYSTGECVMSSVRLAILSHTTYISDSAFFSCATFEFKQHFEFPLSGSSGGGGVHALSVIARQ
jgi:hypothetical protein